MKSAHEGTEREFRSLGVAILVVSDTRTLEDDHSGAFLERRAQEEGHQICGRVIVPDDVQAIRDQVRDWCEKDEVHAVLVTGGTGVFAKDVTPEALEALFDKNIPGFGEMFRMLSWQEIGTATLESRATAGVIHRTLVFVMPGSQGACRLAMEELILPQLDSRTRPCSMGGMVEKL